MATYQILLRDVDFIINENGIVDKRILKHAFENKAVIQSRNEKDSNTIKIEAKESTLIVVFKTDTIYNDLVEFYNRFVSNCAKMCNDLNTPLIYSKVIGYNRKIWAEYKANLY